MGRTVRGALRAAALAAAYLGPACSSDSGRTSESGVAAGSAGEAGSAGSAGESGTGTVSRPHAADVEFCRAELEHAAAHYEGFRSEYTDPSQIPRSANGGNVRLVALDDWTSGFPAGSFWLLYEFTGDEAWRGVAEAWTAALRSQSTRTDTHDVGFVINDSFGQGLRLTGNDDYRAVVIDAAESLSSRFDDDVGATRSWDSGSWSFPVIIDNMMNLELLFDATELGGSPKFREIAISHARTTSENHFRADSSSYHVVDYDPNDGGVIRKKTSQGLNDESAWARGQAWGLYGFTLCYRKTEVAEFLRRAEQIADFYTQSPAMPEDGVPYFDFDAPELADVPDHRDASAGAIAASALFELQRYATGEAKQRYLAFALKAIRSLSSSSYRAAAGTNAHFLLQHSVGNYPRDDEIDVAINYADYYYLEALLRCARLAEEP
jgi:unsaturated chondroitin disaccharide hydrolase